MRSVAIKGMGRAGSYAAKFSAPCADRFVEALSILL